MKTTALRLTVLPLSVILTASLAACQSQGQGSDSAATEAVSGDGVALEPRDQISEGSVATDEPDGTETETEEAPDDSPDDSDQRIHSTNLSVGDCFSQPETGTSEENVDYVTLIDCSQPHVYEVYAEKTLTQSTFPSEEELSAEGEAACTDPAFSDYVGTPFNSSTFEASYFKPTEASWSGGDRLISCILFMPDESETTGSARNSGK